jgi:hypothetical protein
VIDPLVAELRADRIVLRASSRLACWAWLHVCRTGRVPATDLDVKVFAAVELAEAKRRRTGARAAASAPRETPESTGLSSAGSDAGRLPGDAPSRSHLSEATPRVAYLCDSEVGTPQTDRGPRNDAGDARGGTAWGGSNRQVETAGETAPTKPRSVRPPSWTGRATLPGGAA